MDRLGGIVDSRFERDEMGCWHTIVSRDSQLFIGIFSAHKMLFIILNRQRINLFDEVWYVGQHLKNHRDFVEMFQIIGRQKALFIEISASDARSRLLKAQRRGECLVHQIRIFSPILQSKSSNQAITNMRKLITGTQSEPSLL